MEFISNSEAETREFAKTVAERLRMGDAVLFRGEMGAGKTAFTRGAASYFGCEDEVSSPTFALVNEYRGQIPLFHFDLYRISSFDDLYATGFFDYLDRGIMLIEWSENVPELCEELESVVYVTIEKLSENSRKITVSGKNFG